MTPSLDLISLDTAAALVPGADRDTLLRCIRQGRLNAYRVGKSYSTTRADVEALARQCLVVPKVRACGGEPTGC